MEDGPLSSNQQLASGSYRITKWLAQLCFPCRTVSTTAAAQSSGERKCEPSDQCEPKTEIWASIRDPKALRAFATRHIIANSPFPHLWLDRQKYG